MIPAKALIIVVKVVAMKETVKCKKCQLKIISRQTSSIKFRFYVMVELVIKTLISDQVSPAEILALLPSEVAFRLRLDGATTINDIFQDAGPLDSELKWYSFALLALLVEKFGDERCKQELEKYVKLLQTYLQTRSIVNLMPSPYTPIECASDNRAQVELAGEHLKEFSPQDSSNNMPTIKLFVDPEWDRRLVHPDSNKQEREYIACLLRTTTNHIQFVRVA